MGSDEKLQALETMGIILVFTPLLVGIPYFIMDLRSSGSGLGPASGYSSNLMMTAGLITLLYASIQRFREAKQEAEA